MNRYLKRIRLICTVLLAATLLFSENTVSLASNRLINATDNEISSILEKINEEYGTNIHVLSESELAEYGLSATVQQPLTEEELIELEETLRYIAEVQIPQFEQTTQEAERVMEELSRNTDKFNATASTIIATKEIDYATAATEAYITTDSSGNAIWGSIVRGWCSTDVYQETWFMASNPTVTYANRYKSLYWTGEGDYCSYINGTQYYLYSGTQYAYMNVVNYD